MGNFNLPFGVRVSNNNPLDAERYIANDITTRNNLISNGRAFNGLQVYVESDKTLYLLEDITIPKWVVLQSQSGTTIISDPTQILFNSGGTITGSSSFVYDYNNDKIIYNKNNKSFELSSNINDPTVVIKSNYIDGVAIDVASNSVNPMNSPIFSTVKSRGTQSSKSDIVGATSLFTHWSGGYFDNTEKQVVEINISSSDQWTTSSFPTQYKISTISSGNTFLEERFLIDGNGAIKFNNAYVFPQNSGTSNQVLTQSGNGYLYWNDITTSNSLSGLTDTTINAPQEGDKLIYSGGTWTNVTDVDTVYQENIGSGGTYSFVIGTSNNENAYFIHFMNKQNNTVFQMGELQLLHDGSDTQVTTNGQDIDLYVQYTAQISGSDVILICEVPNLSSDVIMK